MISKINTLPRSSHFYDNNSICCIHSCVIWPSDLELDSQSVDKVGVVSYVGRSSSHSRRKSWQLASIVFLLLKCRRRCDRQFPLQPHFCFADNVANWKRFSRAFCGWRLLKCGGKWRSCAAISMWDSIRQARQRRSSLPCDCEDSEAIDSSSESSFEGIPSTEQETWSRHSERQQLTTALRSSNIPVR